MCVCVYVCVCFVGEGVNSSDQHGINIHSMMPITNAQPLLHAHVFQIIVPIQLLPPLQLPSGRLYSLDWSGLDWTGLEWTGLTQKSVKCLFQCRTEVKHTYSVTKVACTACFRVFARVGRGQRSRAYLMSFSNALQSSRG